MNQLQEPSVLKRKQPESNALVRCLSKDERVVLKVIRSKTNTGILNTDLKQEANLPDKQLAKAVKLLKDKNLIKLIVNIKYKTRLCYMGVEFEPSSEVSGGSWYVNGKMDTDFIGKLRERCKCEIQKMKLPTLETVWDAINKVGISRNGISRVEVSMEQVSEILGVLVMENEVMEVRSTGIGEFDSIRAGIVCYKSASNDSKGEGSPVANSTSFPCAVCPQIDVCTPDGAINPIICPYLTKFLKF